MPNIAIVGSGIVGRSFAMIFASQTDNRVSLFDVDSDQLERAINVCRERLQEFESHGWLRGKGTAAEQMARIRAATTLQECLKDADYVQECVPEVQDMKEAIFRDLDQLAPKHCILCSSSSCIPASRFTSGLEHRNRCLVAHPINPPYFVPLVEIVRAPWTDDDAVEKAKTILETAGQAPITLKKEVMGFAANRVQYACINATWNLVHEGILSPEDADKVMSHGLGPRYAFEGPLTVMHLNAQGIEDYCHRYKAGMYEVSSDLNGVPSFEGETLTEISKSFQEKIPEAKLRERREKREEMLAELCSLKKKKCN